MVSKDNNFEVRGLLANLHPKLNQFVLIHLIFKTLLMFEEVFLDPLLNRCDVREQHSLHFLLC